MKSLINPSTIANTVRMAARSRRPKAVFLAHDDTDVAMVKTLLSERECRIIPAHSRENAAKAFEILVKSGWEGVCTAVNTQYASITEQDILVQDPGYVMARVSIEGSWEEIQNHSAILTGRRVRLTVEREEIPSSKIANDSNSAMLHALGKIETILQDVNPKTDKADYLREAREGAMYGLDAES